MYLLIPVELCQWAIKNKFIRPFQLYIQLKSMCDGVIKLNKNDLHTIAESLGLNSIKSVRNNLKLLESKNWIGYSRKSGNYFIRGFNEITLMSKLIGRTAAEFNTKEIQSFKGFIGGAIIGYLVNTQKRKKWLSERHKRGRSIQLSHLSFQYFPVANKALAKILKISPSTAFELKKEAKKGKYILIKKTFNDTNVSSNYKTHYQRVNPDGADRVRIYNNKLFIQGIDLILPTIRFKRRKKIESYKGGS